MLAADGRPAADSSCWPRCGRCPPHRPLLDRLTDAVPVYLVGGAVRDLLLGGRAPRPRSRRRGRPGAGRRRRSAETRGPTTVSAPRRCSLDGFAYDLARSRRETYAQPGRAAGRVARAAWRRICCGATSRSTRWRSRSSAIWPGRWTPRRGRLEDLKRRRLRVLHDASFIDDPTRALRLARYASGSGSRSSHTRGRCWSRRRTPGRFRR